MHLLVAWRLENLQDARCNNKDKQCWVFRLRYQRIVLDVLKLILQNDKRNCFQNVIPSLCYLPHISTYSHAFPTHLRIRILTLYTRLCRKACGMSTDLSFRPSLLLMCVDSTIALLAGYSAGLRQPSHLPRRLWRFNTLLGSLILSTSLKTSWIFTTVTVLDSIWTTQIRVF